MDVEEPLTANRQQRIAIVRKPFPLIWAALPPLLLIYAVAFGGNVFGLLSDARKLFSLALLALVIPFAIRRRIAHPPAAIPLTLMTVVMCASMLASPSPLGAWLVLLWVGVVITLWVSKAVPIAQLEKALLAVFAALALVALYDVIEWWYQSGFHLAAPIRPSSALTNPNIVASVMMIGMALALYTRHRIWLVVFAIVLALTGSRATFIGVGVGAVVLMILQAPRLRLTRTHILVGVGLAILLLPLIVLQAGHSTHGSVGTRADLWQVAITTFFRQPLLGIGPERYRVAFLELAQVEHSVDHVHAHNVYLHIAAEMGIMGLLAFGGVIVAAAWRIRQTFRGENRRGATIAAALMAGLLAHGMLDYVYWVLGLVLMVVWVGRVLLAARPETPATTSSQQSKWRYGLTAFVALVGLPAILLAHYLDYQLSTPYQYTTSAAFLLACVLYWLMADGGASRTVGRPRVAPTYDNETWTKAH